MDTCTLIIIRFSNDPTRHFGFRHGCGRLLLGGMFRGASYSWGLGRRVKPRSNRWTQCGQKWRDISKGVLFGTETGAIVGGLSGGTLSKFGLLNPADSVVLPSLSTLNAFVAATASSGAILGAGKGATEAYAGGRGNFESINSWGCTKGNNGINYISFHNLWRDFTFLAIFGWRDAKNSLF